MSERRKVCVVVASRANYARIKTALEAVRDHPELELQLVAGASLVLERFGNALEVLTMDGFAPDATIRFIIEGETPATMAKSTGLGLLELPTVFELLQPDVVVTVADRFETIATAVAATLHEHPGRAHAGRRGLRLDRRERPPRGDQARARPLPGHRAREAARDRDGRGPGLGVQRRLPVDRPRRPHRPRPAAGRARAVRRHRRAGRPRAAVPARHAAPGHDRVRPGSRPDQRDAGGGRASSACRRSSSGRTWTPARRTSPRGSASSASWARRTASTSSATCRRRCS